mmetsp:Transcript_14219/g.44859  ORF Transcript_14219/g.44859 Transcript_14219/m.44859 type:complete len:127 (-) Transcript_14219:199-579(-)
MAPLSEIVSKLLTECGAAPTKAGLVADVKLVAEIAGVPFTTLRETAEELAAQFGLSLDPPPKPAVAGSWDDWAARTVEANASSSLFGEDDSLAHSLCLQRPSSVFSEDDELMADQIMLQQQLAPPT